MGEPKDMPFDIKRMVYGGFKVLVEGIGADTGRSKLPAGLRKGSN
jgi:hypothetical protein